METIGDCTAAWAARQDWGSQQITYCWLLWAWLGAREMLVTTPLCEMKGSGVTRIPQSRSRANISK